MLGRIWNGRLLGLPMAMVLALGVALSRAGSTIVTILWRGNLRHAGKRVRILSNVTLRHPGRIELGDRVVISSDARIESEFADASCRIGSDSAIGRGAFLDFSGDLTIGTRCVISEGAVIYTHSHGHDPKSQPTKTKLEIGDDVWIGSQAIILEGTTRIGDNALIAAGAVVNREVGNGQVVGGVPGRHLGARAAPRAENGATHQLRMKAVR